MPESTRMKPRIFVAYFGAVFNVGTFSLAGCTADVFVVQVVFRFPRRVTGFGPERPNLEKSHAAACPGD